MGQFNKSPTTPHKYSEVSMEERPGTPAQGEQNDPVLVDSKASDPIATRSALPSQRLPSTGITRLLEWAWNGIVTLLPLFFIGMAGLYNIGRPFADERTYERTVLSIVALRLNGEPTSKYGARVIEVTRLSPTIYPILFAMVTARFYKNLARWRLERPRGIRLSVLEQISGSQSFASAIERFCTIRTQLLLGSLILFTWSLSPLGGQSSSRLISIESNVEATNGTIYYGYADRRSSVYTGSNSWTSDRSIVTSIYTTVLLSDPKSKRAWSDSWQNLRIPMLPRTESNNMDGSWRQVNSTALALGHDTYASLVGLKVQGLHFVDRTTQYDFNVAYSYVEFTCSQARVFSSFDEADNFLSDKEFNLTARLYHSDDGEPNSVIKISLQNSTTSKSFDTNALDHVPPLNLSYIAISGLVQYPEYYQFDCAPKTIDVETRMSCTEDRCTPIQQRRLPDHRPPTRSFPTSINWSDLSIVTEFLPTMAGKTRYITASPTENFIADDEPLYRGQSRRWWNGTNMEVFSDRFTTIFNTAWQAGLESQTIINASLTALPTFEDGILPLGTNATSARITSLRNVYRANMAWVAVLMFITLLLQGLAIAGFVLQFLIRGPDILGFASTLTRDNSFVPVSGGSALEGTERARALGDLRLRLSDVLDGEDGYIAVNAILPEREGENVGSEEGTSRFWRALDKHRVYT